MKALTENRILTDAELRKLIPGDHPDGLVPGLVFRVRETGGRSWALRYRVGSRLRRLTLGSYPALKLSEARTEARAARRVVARGEDPAEAKRRAREADTVGELVESYLEKWAKPRKRTWKNDQYVLNAHVLPAWRHVPVAEITRPDVRRLLEEVTEKAGPIGSNRLRALLSKLFNYAISRDVVENNPVIGTIPNPEKARDRVLSEDEIRKIWTWSGSFAKWPVMGVRLRLQLATAQRGGEVAGMKWADVDLENSLWTIPAERSKNGLAHRVPLSPLALELMAPLSRESEYVVAGGRGRAQLWKTMTGAPVENFRGHDLRRTAASYMTSIGIPRFVVGRILNHMESGVTAVYDRFGYDIEKRDALNRWALKLRSILEAKPADVVRFRR